MAQLEASRKELVVQVTRGGFSIDTLRGRQFEQMTRLRTLNRYSALLRELIESPAITPFRIYLELRMLLGELVALQPNQDELFSNRTYDHDNPYPCFKEVSDKIRAFLQGVVTESYYRVPFEKEDGLLVASLEEKHFTDPNGYYLAIKTKADARALAGFVEDGDRFKLMAKSKATARAAIYGIELKWDQHPPLELPAQADLHYFRIVRHGDDNERRWKQIQGEKIAAVDYHVTPEVDLGDAQYSLYMTVPNPSV